MRDIFTGIGFLLWGLCKIIWKLLAIPMAALLKARVGFEASPKQRPVSMAINSPAHDELGDSGPATIIQSGAFDVADRIVSIKLDPPVGVINLRIYNAPRLIKRDLIISEPRLKAMMRGRRHAFPDTPYDPVAGIESVKDESIDLAEKLINALGSQSVRAAKPATTQAKPKVSRPAKEASDPVATEPAVTTAPAVEGTKDLPTQVFAPKAMKGITYVGKLVGAQTEMVRPQGRPPYEIFQATLLLDNGVELPLRGAELERELTGSSCQVGNRVAITPMGKVPVTLGNGNEGSKNLYRVRNMTSGGKD